MGIGGPDETAFEFTGNWREFLPIALTNGLLNIVTLSMWRFWGTTRERDYLWSRTRFIDDQLEWTGKGMELFIGFLMALLLFVLPSAVLLFLFQALMLQGQEGLAALMFLALFVLGMAITGFAKFRALRYRLSRTEWHGIRGGSDDPGFRYAWESVWRTILGYLPMSLMVPWSMTSLWKLRWEAMSFGPHQFASRSPWENLLLRYALCVLVGPFVVIFGMAMLIGILAAVFIGSGGSEFFESVDPTSPWIGVFAVLAVALFYLPFIVLPIIYYAAFFREAVNGMMLSTLEFDFTARTKDWIKLFLGNGALFVLAFAVAGLIAAPFGVFAAMADLEPGAGADALGAAMIGVLVLAYLVPFSMVMPFITYRNWAFFVRFMEAGGEINLADLTQSTTRREAQGEGLLDALDVGAI